MCRMRHRKSNPGGSRRHRLDGLIDASGRKPQDSPFDTPEHRCQHWSARGAAVRSGGGALGLVLVLVGPVSGCGVWQRRRVAGYASVESPFDVDGDGTSERVTL